MSNKRNIITFELDDETLKILDTYSKDVRNKARSKIIRELIEGVKPTLKEEINTHKKLEVERLQRELEELNKEEQLTFTNFGGANG